MASIVDLRRLVQALQALSWQQACPWVNSEAWFLPDRKVFAELYVRG